MVTIEVLGTDCVRCGMVQANVEEALRALGTTADVVRVEDPDRITERGVVATPALIVDGRLQAEGRVPCVAEIVQMVIGRDRDRG